MSDSNTDYSGPRVAFEAIGSSVWRALQRLNQSGLSSLYLLLAYFQFRALTLAGQLKPSEFSMQVFEQLQKIDEESAHLIAKDRRRYTLLAGIGILDSFLSDSLRFLFLQNPQEIPAAEKRNTSESEPDFVERVVRRSPRFQSQRKRIEFLGKRFSVSLDGLLLELEVLTHLRNELAHHPGLYRFKKDEKTGAIWAQPKPLPEVSDENATKTQVIVTEVCDSLLVAMCRALFGNDPRVRPLTPEVAAVHQSFRQEWTAKREAAPKIEEFAKTRWSVRDLAEPSALWVEDHTSSFMIMPTGIEVVPALISFRRNNCHGTTASISIDEREIEELSNSRQILEQMLAGESVLVKFFEEPEDEPKYARFSLEGFGESWKTACQIREKKFPNDAMMLGGVSA